MNEKIVCDYCEGELTIPLTEENEAIFTFTYNKQWSIIKTRLCLIHSIREFENANNHIERIIKIA